MRRSRPRIYDNFEHLFPVFGEMTPFHHRAKFLLEASQIADDVHHDVVERRTYPHGQQSKLAIVCRRINLIEKRF